MNATGWKESTVRTYMSKQYRDFLKGLQSGEYAVGPEFHHIDEEAFLELATQKRRVFSVYKRARYSEVVTYEFLLPLTRGDQLRKALDALFYEDTLRQRLSEIGPQQLNKWTKRETDESDDDYLGRVCNLISSRFFGYSISHVSGRFRAATLRTRELAAKMLATGKPYVIDETTASVRFIIPIESAKVSGESRIDDVGLHDAKPSPINEEELSLVHSLFFHLFVEAVVRMVQGEDEIWLVEDTGHGCSLYVYERA